MSFEIVKKADKRPVTVMGDYEYVKQVPKYRRYKLLFIIWAADAENKEYVEQVFTDAVVDLKEELKAECAENGATKVSTRTGKGGLPDGCKAKWVKEETGFIYRVSMWPHGQEEMAGMVDLFFGYE